jgi:hypothetical protein
MKTNIDLLKERLVVSAEGVAKALDMSYAEVVRAFTFALVEINEEHRKRVNASFPIEEHHKNPDCAKLEYHHSC